MAVTTVEFTLGRQAVLPGTFDSNGIAVSVASDGIGNREDAVTLAQMLWSSRFHEWFSVSYPFHVKLYSIGFAVIGGFLGFNILSAEPLNLFCYLGILIFVYKVGNEIFDSRAALIGSGMVALWPSFLLHTTQLLKDPLFTLGMLALILIMMRLLTRPYSWRQSLLHSAVGSLMAAALWKIRSDMGAVLMATVLLGALLLVVRQFQLKHALTSNLAGMALLTLLTTSTLLWLPVYRDADNPRVREAAITAVGDTVKPKPDVRWWQVPARIGIIRDRFAAKYPNAHSNMDADVKLASIGDVIRYLPRALTIGLFAPFPDMWFGKGSSVGPLGRMLGGLETLIMYVIELLAIVGFWRARPRPSVWLLLSIAVMGIAAIGLVVVNIGALYRLRYLYLILLIILAAGGIRYLIEWFMKRRSSQLV